MTVNKNWQTAVHQDAGDFPDGLGNLTVLEAGDYTGGYFCLPQYRVAVDVRNYDCLLADVHTWHGNTPIIPVKPGRRFVRLSLVMYYRNDMIFCGSVEEELARAKKGIRTKK